MKYQKELKEKELQILKLKAESRKELTQDELDELYAYDREGYDEYITAQAEVDEYKDQIKNVENDIANLGQQAIVETMNDNVSTFVASVLNIDPKTVPDDPMKWPKEIRDFMASDEYAAVAKNIDVVVWSEVATRFKNEKVSKVFC